MLNHPSIVGNETEQERRRRSRRTLFTAFATIAAVIGLSLIAPGVLCYRVWSEIRRLDGGFARIDRGIINTDVRAIMSEVDAGIPRATPNSGAWWMNEPLPAAETARIKSTDTWRPELLPFMRYEVTYDAAGRVVGKRRYD